MAKIPWPPMNSGRGIEVEGEIGRRTFVHLI
jgi:hypothetical protein